MGSVVVGPSWKQLGSKQVSERLGFMVVVRVA